MAAPAPCGTNAAYLRHRRRGEDACDACLAAHAADKGARQERSRPDPIDIALPSDNFDLRAELMAIRYATVLALTSVPADAAAPLLARWQDVAESLAGLKSGKEPSLAEQLAAAREARASRVDPPTSDRVAG